MHGKFFVLYVSFLLFYFLSGDIEYLAISYDEQLSFV